MKSNDQDEVNDPNLNLEDELLPIEPTQNAGLNTYFYLLKYFCIRVIIGTLITFSLSLFHNFGKDSYMSKFHEIFPWLNIFTFPIVCFGLGKAFYSFRGKRFRIKNVSYFSELTSIVFVNFLIMIAYYGSLLVATFYLFQFSFLLAIPFILIYLLDINSHYLDKD